MRRLSLGVLAAAAGVLLLSWDRIPARWVIHWGLGDVPDGWAQKSLPAVLAPLGLGLGILLLVEAIAVWMRRRGATTVALAPEFVDVQVELARLAAFSVSLLSAALALVLPLLRPRSSVPIVVGAFLCVGLTLTLGTLRARAEVRRLRARGVSIPQGYEGLVYRNPRDHRLWVPKLMGMGWTINFAHRLAWPLLAAFIAAPLAMVAAILRFAR